MRTTAAMAIAALAGVLPATELAGQQARAGERVTLQPEAWEVAGDGTIGTWKGEPAILLRRGQAVHTDVELGDGVLEFELLVPEGRTFVGVKLREGPDGTFEDIYLRPHKSGLPDAVQYNPAYRGVSQWQLWHGPGATAFADFEPGATLPVRIEVTGDRASLFLADAREPTLVTSRLATGRSDGRIGFTANRPGATPDDPWTAVITKVRVQRTAPPPPVRTPPAPTHPPGTIERWEVSRPWGADASAADRPQLPTAIVAGPWTEVPAEPGGLLALQRHLPRPEEGVPTVLARTVVERDRPGTVRLDLGFSDDVTVFLNGRPVAAGRNGYSYDAPRRDGLLTPDQLTVHLPLRVGQNEVVVRVSDVFGGWGLQGRLVDESEPEGRPAGSLP